MKPTCGYIDENGHFWKTSEKAELANSIIRIKKIEDYLNNFSNEVNNVLFKQGHHFTEIEERTRLNEIEEHIYKQISMIVLNNSDEWKQLHKEKEKAISDLNKLRLETKFQRWWLKYKWW